MDAPTPARPAAPPALEDRARASLAAGADLHRWLAEEAAPTVAAAARLVADALATGGKVLTFGNGGSAADAQHLAAELVVRFVGDRAALAAVALTTDTSTLTAIGNDLGFERLFSRQVEALGARGDVAVALSTSGRSPNVLAALRVARERGLRTVALGGPPGRPMAELADV